ncbi:MAG: DNA primase [Candidatus Nealsonbacteria bacterium RIFOXYB1_FULL_40_15]|uniref:DNA primase n=2 Tax=Candidatus Nealsoniibacteriota TaxID=1817911 RepID=A0A1G2EU52_9BACT|nr:MAG: DNA primase [Candidatus Nealsonbacteria bacterium RIFOXYB1_FULL_40_15]OGZ29237.1 MAG: DNA primase [Candidatus Nealsonbacteria bacterium RIFOXYC1_FULL_40_7]OGZ29397.1 MAG: DNA primase [Candidatus Nealsonbacteria bacterium RIFOXYD1_FULL_39_11]
MNSPIEEIKSKLDVVEVVGSYIKLQKAGVNYRACCPFHNEKKPSFFVNPARQIWHCFGQCGEGGDIFKFVMKVEGVEFGDALRILAQKAGVELKREDPKLVSERKRLYETAELACSFYQKQLSGGPAEYLKKRGVSEESIQKWRIGYSPENWDSLTSFLKTRGYSESEIEKAGLCIKSQKTGRYFDRFRSRIMFPIFNINSDPVAFGGRVFNGKDDEAKYINSPAGILYDKSSILYGLNFSGREMRKENACILVEGYMDAIMASQSGVKNVAAVSGTALTINHLRVLKRYSENLYTAFDMDLAGDSATRRGVDLAQAEGFDIKVVMMPGKDPADVALENPALLKDLISQAKSIYDFYFSSAFSKFDKNTVEGKKEISKQLLPAIKKIPNKIEQAIWIKGLASALGVGEEYVSAELEKAPIEQPKIREEESKPLNLTRKELLGERIAVLALKYPELCDISLDLRYFSLSQVKIMDYLIKNKKEDFQCPEDIKEKIDFLWLKKDQENFENPKEEFSECLKQLKLIFVREKMDSISKEIRTAEEEKDMQKVQELISKFNQEIKFLEI